MGKKNDSDDLWREYRRRKRNSLKKKTQGIPKILEEGPNRGIAAAPGPESPSSRSST